MVERARPTRSCFHWAFLCKCLGVRAQDGWRGEGGAGEGPAEEAVDRLLGRGFLDDLMSEVDEGGVQLTGEGGFCRSW